MTDPAPPARTTLTPREWAAKTIHYGKTCSGPGAMGGPRLCAFCEQLAADFETAITAARAGGRLVGLREAAALVENLDYPLDCGPGFVLDAAADAVRSLAEAGPKAPKNQADPEPR